MTAQPSRFSDCKRASSRASTSHSAANRCSDLMNRRSNSGGWVISTSRSGSRGASNADTVIQAGRGALLLLWWCSHVSAQAASNAPVLQQQEQWSFSASAYSYFPPDAGTYLQPTLTADR